MIDSIISSLSGSLLLLGSWVGITPSITNVGGGTGTITQLSPWLVSGGYIKSASTTAGLQVQGLGSPSNPCINVGTTGIFATTTCVSSLTPWTSAINGGGFALTNAGTVTATNFVATSTTALSYITNFFGIGTSNPEYSLDISGDTLNSSGIRQVRSSGNSFAVTNRIFKSRGTETVPTGVLLNDTISRNEGYAFSDGAFRNVSLIDIISGASTTNAIGGRFNLALTTSGGVLTNRFNIVETGASYLNGNLSVNSSIAPTVPLDVTGIIKSSSGIQGTYFQGNGAGATLYPNSTTQANALIVYGNDGASSFVERMRLTNLGNLGIGTTSPYARLSIVNRATSTPAIVLTDPLGRPSLEIRAGTSTALNTYIGVGVGGLTTIAVGNTAVGYESLFSTKQGGSNTALGYRTLYSNTGDNNTAIGISALLSNTTGAGNTAIGGNPLYSNLTGNSNTAIGDSALFFNTANDNTAIGASSLYSNTSGTGNTAIGNTSLSTNSTGNFNTAFGAFSLLANTTGSNNTAIGIESISNNDSGIENSALGIQSLQGNLSGSYNVAIGGQSLFILDSSLNTGVGYQSGASITSGANNTFLGYAAGYGDGRATTTATLTNATAIGYNAQVTRSNSLILGGIGAFGVNVGIGTTSPYAKLSVVGEIVGTNFTATSTTATSTISGPLKLGSTGTSPTAGNATLVTGTKTITTGAALSTGFVHLTRKTSGGTIGTAITYTITNGSFTITSDSVLDTSTFTWLVTN